MFGNNKNIHVSITTNTIIKAVVIVTLAMFATRFIGYLATPLKMIAVSVFLSIALNPAVSWISRKLRSKSRVRATAVAYLIVLFIITGFLILVIPPIASQAADVASNIPTSVDDINNQNTAIVRFIRDNGLTDEYTEFVTGISSNLQDIGKRAVSAISTIGTAVIGIITVLVMTFMMLVEGPSWLARLWDMQSRDIERRKRMVSKMYRMVTGYVNGQLLIATIAALFALVALLITSTVLDVTINAVSLAVIVGLIGLIPMIGNTLAAAIVVTICLFVSVPLALTMAVFFLIYQQVENATLQPYIQSKYNELTPLTVFLAALLGVGVAGFLGALVAIPVAGCIRIVMLELYGHRLKPKEALARD